jgi:hypothetical protein
MNLKAGDKIEQMHLEAEFGQSNFSQPSLGEVKQMQNFSTQLYKKNQVLVHIKKLRLFYQTTSELGF